MLGVRDGRSTQQPIRSCPAPALQELLYPCCEAGGFFCLSCPAEGEKALLLSHNSAYNHMRRCAPNRPVPKGDFQSIFEWLHTEIAPRKFHDYSALLGARELHPAIPGRPVLRGWACDKCSHGFKEIGNAKRHSQGACSPAGTSAALIMELSERHFVAVSPLAADERFQHLTPLNATLAARMRMAALQPQPLVDDVEMALLDLAVLGSSQVTAGGTARHPPLLAKLNWCPNLNAAQAAEIAALTHPNALPATEAVLRSQAVLYFVEAVAPTAASSPLQHRVDINHAFQVSGAAKLSIFKPCTPETHTHYAQSLADAVVFAYRVCRLPNFRPRRTTGGVDQHARTIAALARRLDVLISNPKPPSEPEKLDEELMASIGSFFYLLVSEPSYEIPAAAAALGAAVDGAVTPEPPLCMRLSLGAPLLVTWLCCSLVSHSADRGTTFASAAVCRKRAVALIFGIKAYVLYRLTTATQPANNDPAAPAADISAPLGDPLASQLLGLLRGTASTFQLLVTVAATARHQADVDGPESGASWTTLQLDYKGHQYADKVIFCETMHLARVCSRADFHTALATVLRDGGFGGGGRDGGRGSSRGGANGVGGNGNRAGVAGGGAGSCGSSGRSNSDFNIAALVSTLEWIDKHDLSKPFLFSIDASVIDESSSKAVASMLTLNPEAKHHLQKLVTQLSVALYFDLMIGPRVTEYVELLALPSSGLDRDVSIAVDGTVHLHVSSKKNSLSATAALSPELSDLVRLYLFLVRSRLSMVLFEQHNESHQWSRLLPGLTADTMRRHIKDFFSLINAECMQRRLTSRGVLPLPVQSLSDIGPRIIRQYIHFIVHNAVPSEYAHDLRLLQEALVSELPHAQASLQHSPAFDLFVHTMVAPQLYSAALHTPITADTHYGRSSMQPSLLSRQTAALRAMLRLILSRRAEPALQQFPLGATRPEAALAAAAAASSAAAAATAAAMAAAAAGGGSGSGSGGGGGGTGIAADAPSLAAFDGVAAGDGGLGQAPPPPLVLPPSKRLRVEEDSCSGIDNLLALRERKPEPYLSAQQKQLVHLAVSGCNTLAIMPTGSGKTLSVIAFAALRHKEVALLVLPLVALAEEMLVRLRDWFGGLEHTVMAHNGALQLPLKDFVASTRVVLVTVDQLSSVQLRSRLSQSAQHGRRLACIFLDEAHLLLSYASFRREFANVRDQLHAFAVPLVALTATATPRTERAILEHIFGASNPVEVLRVPCNRKNICYRVERAEAMANWENEFAEKLRELLSEQPWAGSQAIVFALTYSDCDAVLGVLNRSLPHLNAAVYSSDVALREQSKALLDEFRGGQRRVLIGTEAIGCGLNLPGVGIVVHFGAASGSVETFVQQSGRAARPGGSVPVGLSYVYALPRVREQHKRTLELNSALDTTIAERFGLSTALQMFAETAEYEKLVHARGTCRRRWLSERLDGRTNAAPSCSELAASTNGTVIDQARCDLCTRGTLSHSAAMQAAVEVDNAQQRVLHFAVPLAEARTFLNDRLCVDCSFASGATVRYRGALPRGAPCTHQQLAQLNRCFACGSSRHQGRDCTVLRQCGRCYVCLSSASGGHRCEAQNRVRDPFIAALALERGSNQLWASLIADVPLLATFDRSRLLDPRHEAEARRELFSQQFLLQPIDHENCVANQVVVAVAKYLRGK